MKVVTTHLFIVGLVCLQYTLFAFNTPDSLTHTSSQPDSTKEKVAIAVDVTFASRFIWRGLELGDHPQIQPNVTISKGNWFVGIWASHGIAPVAFDKAIEGYKEVIPYIGYNFKLAKAASLSLLLLDHYNPNAGRFSNFRAEGRGNNRVEFRSIWNIGKFDMLASIELHNDPTQNNSIYVEMGYTLEADKGYSVRPMLSFSPGPDESLYGTDGFEFTQFGLITSKTLKIGKSITVPIKADFIYNPTADRFWTAINVGFKF